MEEYYDRERSILVPLIYTLFCLCVTIGGALLVLHVYFPPLSQPWQPIAAVVLIASTWVFWIITCLYACIKACCFRRKIAAGAQAGGRMIDSSVASSTDSKIPLAYAAA